MKLRALVACGLLAGLMVSGCNSDSSDSKAETSTSTSAGQAVCAAKAKLEESVKQLVDPATLAGGKRGVSDAVDAVKSNLDALRAAAESDVQPNVTAVRDAVDEVQVAVGNLSSASITDGLQDVGNAVAKVGSTAGNLVTSLQPSCAN